MSRFPHYWIYMAGLFSWGWLAAGYRYDWWFAVWALWFAAPGNFFYCAINDAFDQDQDAMNPRKNDIEGAATPGERGLFLLVSTIALATALPLLFFVDRLAIIVFLVWVACTLAYNVPPLRLKVFPFLDVVFGGVGQCATVGLFGYVLASGTFPPIGATVWFYMFVATYHFMGASFDAPFDRACGLSHTTACIGSVRRSLRVSAGIAVAAAVAAPLLFDWRLVFPPLVMAAFCLAESARKDVESDTRRGFRRYTAVVVALGLAVGTYMYRALG
jgi:4-hydroxybenzoate polyprenyltransferase